jgi:hypothetical protein
MACSALTLKEEIIRLLSFCSGVNFFPFGFFTG